MNETKMNPCSNPTFNNIVGVADEILNTTSDLKKELNKRLRSIFDKMSLITYMSSDKFNCMGGLVGGQEIKKCAVEKSAPTPGVPTFEDKIIDRQAIIHSKLLSFETVIHDLNMLDDVLTGLIGPTIKAIDYNLDKAAVSLTNACYDQRG